MPVIYVSGPMTGIEHWNFPAFAAAVADLRSAGYDVVSPHEVALPCGCSGGPARCGADEHTWAEYLRGDLVALLDCTAVALLPGWESSRGAALETHVAKALGMPVRPVAEWLAAAEAGAA